MCSDPLRTQFKAVIEFICIMKQSLGVFQLVMFRSEIWTSQQHRVKNLDAQKQICCVMTGQTRRQQEECRCCFD